MLGALSFTSPLILGALLAAPLIWYLLRATPPSPSRVRFPAFTILRTLQTKEETPDRTPWWLLLLRLVLAALIIIGLAGPILNAPQISGGARPLVFVIDNSWAAAANWGARKDLLLSGAEEAAANNRPVFLVTTAPQRTPQTLSPMTGEEVRDATTNLQPLPLSPDRMAAIMALETAKPFFDENGAAEIRWLTDGVATEDDDSFIQSLEKFGGVTAYLDRRADQVILRALGDRDGAPGFRVERLNGAAPFQTELVAFARDGRELTRVTLELTKDTRESELSLDLPLALQNELATVRLANVASAGAVQLADARNRRALIGLVSQSGGADDRLLSGEHYLQKALSPYAEFLGGDLETLMASDVSVIVLDDIGRLRASDVEALTEWVERGGVLIRFAGPTLALAAQDGKPALLPTPLRGGGRAFGGALTWETPQRLDAFPANGPFSSLQVPKDVFIKRQVLAQPGGETTERTWARLADGTPLVTGARQGAGAIALFHVTATPEWSDLPFSGAFLDMLRRLIFLSALGPEGAENEGQTKYQALRLLNGYGQFIRPGDDAAPLTAAEIDEGPSAERWPGLYGAPDAPLTLNAVTAHTKFERISTAGVTVTSYATTPPRRISPYLFVAAFALLLIDAIATLLISGRLRLAGLSRASAAAAPIVVAVFAFASEPANAQPLDTEITSDAIDGALETRLAYVLTGDPTIDRTSQQGLAALSRELIRRTSVEPAPPVGVDPETADLSVYPFLYWPIAPGADSISDAALSNIEDFMRFGGMILFDTRDDERAVGGATTPEAAALQSMLSRLDVPPLTPVDPDHVMLRSFYLLGDLWGRHRTRPVWVQTRNDSANDAVTPIVIGGRDWAGAWATDDFGRAVKPMGASARGRSCSGGPRECSYRAGVNIIMVALTGNYKFDQVHTPILLERLGQ